MFVTAALLWWSGCTQITGVNEDEEKNPHFLAGKSRVNSMDYQGAIGSFEKALDTFRLDVGRYPSTDQGLPSLNEKPADEVKWQGPYLAKAVPKDPWGRDYVYRSPGEHAEYDLISLGKDGRTGGEGDDSDVVSW